MFVLYVCCFILWNFLLPIVRKDDYAFFLKPVDLRLVPGYTDVVQRPMDFGTITTKVAKGKYRSLEDFAVRI
jgi:bromodomain-containing protein 7